MPKRKTHVRKGRPPKKLTEEKRSSTSSPGVDARPVRGKLMRSQKMKNKLRGRGVMKMKKIPVQRCKSAVLSKLKSISPIPHIKVHENVKLLPKYTAVAARSFDEGIDMHDLDTLQGELETLLCTAALKTRHVQSVIKSITREKKNTVSTNTKLPKSSLRTDEVDGSDTDPKSPTSKLNVPKLKDFNPIISPVPVQGSFSNDNILTTDNVKLKMSPVSNNPKNNVPLKFWQSIEPYCKTITTEEVKYIESLLASSSISPPGIPALGKHYSDSWINDNISDDHIHSKHKSSDESITKKNIDKSLDSSVNGSSRSNADFSEEHSSSNKTKKFKSKQNSSKKFMILENCLRRELIRQGILKPEDTLPEINSNDDDILIDLKKCLGELSILRKTNIRNLRNLIAVSKQDMVRSELKKKLHQVDVQLTEMYKKKTMCKQQKQAFPKKDREESWRLIKEQIRLNEEINSLTLKGTYT